MTSAVQIKLEEENVKWRSKLSMDKTAEINSVVFDLLVKRRIGLGNLKKISLMCFR